MLDPERCESQLFNGLLIVSMRSCIRKYILSALLIKLSILTAAELSVVLFKFHSGLILSDIVGLSSTKPLGAANKSLTSSLPFLFLPRNDEPRFRPFLSSF